MKLAHYSATVSLAHARVLVRLSRLTDSIVYYNEVLQRGSGKTYWKGLAEVAIVEMQLRDFYESEGYLRRGKTKNEKDKMSSIDELSKLAEGVTFLMKKKFG